MTLEAKIESILFFKAEPVSLKELSLTLGESLQSVKEATENLGLSLEGRGVCLLNKDDELEIRTAPEASEIIEGLVKEERAKELGRAGLETMAIIMYQGFASRREIDYIRGVNSTFILRNLLVRGLVERIPHPNDKRSFAYRPSFEMLGYLGIKKVEEMPEFASVREAVEDFKQQSQKEDDSLSDGAL
ncbi:MAG: SMC-Scp complex subunit ScpB [bacterium]|nr:SMC-Scp complex subunit ScpB [bacterium]